MKGNTDVTISPLRPPPQALKANSQREGVKVNPENAELLLEALETIASHSNPKPHFDSCYGCNGLHRINNRLSEMTALNDPLHLVVNKLQGGYTVGLVSDHLDQYGTGIVRSEILYPPPQDTHALLHAENIIESLKKTADRYAAYPTEPREDKMNEIALTLGLPTNTKK